MEGVFEGWRGLRGLGGGGGSLRLGGVSGGWRES